MNPSLVPDKTHERSKAAHARARKVLPGGVNSPVRAYRAVGGSPIVVKSGQGAIVTDVDDNKYVDYVMSYGPLILGHAPAHVLKAVGDAAVNGTSFGMPTELETELAEMVIKSVPGLEMVRFVSSGTEACMSAIRLARAATGRNKIIKCTGCYHGHTDALLVEAGSGATTLGVPSSAGVSPAITAGTLLVPFNDLAAVENAFAANPGEIACMAIEPIAGNMGTVAPKKGYLQGLRALCDKHGALLLFDEVMTGFRVALGGAQVLYGVKPDISCFGKVIGGGLPCAAYGASLDIMKNVSPLGPMYQAGTLSGNPLAMAAGKATLVSLKDGSAYTQLEKTSATLHTGLERAAANAGVALTIARVGSMITPFFTHKPHDPVENYDQAIQCDTKAFGVFFLAMLDAGVILPPSQFETWFTSTAHDDAAIQHTIAASERAFAAVKASRG